MKKLILALCAAAATFTVQAQEAAPAQPKEPSRAVLRAEDDALMNSIWKRRAKYFNVAYVSQQMTLTDNGSRLNSKFGVALSSGKTYYLHKKPIAGMMKFGIDWTWMDLNYAGYAQQGLDAYDHDDAFELGLHQIDVGMQIGASFTINPVDHLKVAVYFRYAPTFSMALLDDAFGYNYVSFFNAGLSVSYRIISIGFENRWGNARYNNLGLNEDGDYSTTFNSFKRNMKTNSMRVYVSFRF